MARGLVLVHFHDSGFTRPVAPSIEPRIDFDTGTEHTDYSRIILGRIRIPTSSPITFTAEADNGLVLVVGGRDVIDGWDSSDRAGRVAAREGEILPLEVRYHQSGGTAHLRMFWAWEGHARELIPADAFLHAAADLEQGRDMAAGKVVPARPGRRAGPIYEAGGPHSGRRPTAAGAIALAAGPHLFLDDWLVEATSKVTRKPMQAGRDPAIPNPVVTGAKDHGDRNFQPWLSCLQDPQTGRFRFWYNIGIDAGTSGLGYLESDDGIRWGRPHRQLPQPVRITYGAGVIDEGLDFQPAADRYKLAFFGKGGAVEIWASADGGDWRWFAAGPQPTSDIVNLARDTARGRYLCTFGTPAVPADGYRGSTPNAAEGQRRLVGQSTSTDLKQWSPPRRIFMPGDNDEGVTEVYGVGGLRNCGELIIGLLKVLRDDLPCDPGGPVNGIGYTVVAWTRDGEHWLRERQPLLDRDHKPGAWDHAHAWADVQLPVGDELFIYYGGYKGGHKVNRFEERQVGLVRMRRDRYVAREAGAETGWLRTPVVAITGDAITLNVEPTAAGGEVRVQVVDEAGAPVPGFAFADCAPVTADHVAAPVRWSGDPARLRGRPVRLEFSLKNARLYALGVR